MSEARPVARYRRVTDWKALTDAWAGVDRVLWHPNPRPGKLLGLYNEGSVFNWSPSEGSSQEVRARASKFEFSPNGALFITSDITGIIKVWNYQHFAFIYQLSWEPGITGLCFGPDHGRFYDLSGSACNVGGLTSSSDLPRSKSERGKKKARQGAPHRLLQPPRYGLRLRTWSLHWLPTRSSPCIVQAMRLAF